MDMIELDTNELDITTRHRDTQDSYKITHPMKDSCFLKLTWSIQEEYHSLVTKTFYEIRKIINLTEHDLGLLWK